MILQPLHFIGLRAAILVPPAMERRLANRQLLTQFANRLARREDRFRLPQLLDNLLKRMLFALHFKDLLASM